MKNSLSFVIAAILLFSFSGMAYGQTTGFKTGIYALCGDDSPDKCLASRDGMLGDNYTFFDNFTGIRTAGTNVDNFKWLALDKIVIISTFINDISLVRIHSEGLIYDGENYYVNTGEAGTDFQNFLYGDTVAFPQVLVFWLKDRAMGSTAIAVGLTGPERYQICLDTA